MKLGIIILSPLVIVLTTIIAPVVGFWPALQIAAVSVVLTLALVLWVKFCVERFG